MRFCLPALLIAAVLAPQAQAATRNFGLSGYDRIRVEGPFRVRLATGVAPYARAVGTADAVDRVAITVEGRTLVVRSSSAWGGSVSGGNFTPATIELGTHDLTSAWLNGAGTLKIDKVKGLSFDASVQGSGAMQIDRADVDQLKVAVSGTAAAIIAGKAARMTTTVRGISTLDSANLIVKDATVGAEGAATVKAHVTNAVKIDGSGPATISLSGNPACTAKLAGSASVSGCKETR
ncbi:DUF2807 domain-containing protein [Sphingomonas lutea]|uniref:DUF2807 domain-containing protein n=1 Tax=Sphingomonas lutea TaxID=1045317 RepID=A0A7G9SI37_9SPHN|nr:DUF2807 domain-containing protein [Sphingomonas lutea]QNN67512.1 DUF2807 domain-containing protein [Sphingomonas lutea]